MRKIVVFLYDCRLKIGNVIQAYGMTETTLGVLFVQPEAHKLGAAGKVVPAMSAKVSS